MNDQEQNAKQAEEQTVDRTAMHAAEYDWADTQVDYPRLHQICVDRHLIASRAAISH